MGGRDSFARVQILTGVRHCSTALIRRPFVNQCVASFVLLAPGDVLAQQVHEKKCANHDVRLPFPFTANKHLRVSVWVLTVCVFSSGRRVVVVSTPVRLLAAL